jgi:hypothetical protein
VEKLVGAPRFYSPKCVEEEFFEVRGYKRAALCGSQAPYRDPHSCACPLLAIDGYVRVENLLRAVASCYGPTPPRISMVGPLLVCLVGKNPRESSPPLWATTREED